MALSYFIAYGFRIGAFYLGLPIAGWFMAPDEMGRFFYLLAIVNLTSVGASLGMASYLTRKAYSRRSLTYVFVLANALASGIHAFAALIAFACFRDWLMVVVVSWMRVASLLGETFLLASGNRAAVTRLNWQHGTLYLAAGAIAAALTRAAEAFLIATAVADMVIVAAAWASIRSTPRQTPYTYLTCTRAATNVQVLTRGVFYSAPVLLASLANLGLNSFDRFIVKHFLGYAEVAVFSMMYTLSFASNRFVAQPFNQLAAQSYMRDRGSVACQAEIKRQGVIAARVIAAFTLAATLFGNRVLTLVGPDYRVEPANFLLVGLSSLFAMLFALSSLHLKRMGRTAAFALRVSAAAVVNVVLSLALVPLIGILGASVSTYVAYAALFLSNWKASSDDLVSDGNLLAVLGIILLVALLPLR